jgi:hypothetical protein
VKPAKLAASGDLDPIDGEEDGDEEIADERGMPAVPLDPVLRCKIAERGMSNRTAAAAAAVGDDADTGVRPSSCGLWLLPEPAYGLSPGLGIAPLADVVTPASNGESSPPLVAEVGERGSTMARADADEMSALEDVSGLELHVRMAAEVDWDNKNGPAVLGLPSSLQSSKTESRLD